MNRRARVTAVAVAGVAGTLSAFLLLGGGTDPVAECSTAAGQVWSRALDARTVAEVDALPALKSLPACKGLTAEEQEEFHRRNAQQEDRVAGHVVRLALNEQEN
ncbi:hypothetical protein ABT348_24170 [Streptomyces olivaceus]|uniref:hypothetical protein n=1 Tax=Streptomyces olivaceus TaxID=47716 RepID=UPI0033290EF3